MSELVFIDNKTKEPFTTSDIIAECAGVKRKAVQNLIQKYEQELKEFGKVVFEIRPLKESKTGQSAKVYHLNEQQATFLLTLLKNTPVVVGFKKELVRQFYAMRSELMKRQINRQPLKPVRRTLTDVIKEKDDGKWSYKKYTDLAYKSALGKSASQIRAERGADKKANAVDFMTADELSIISKRQEQVSLLLDLGMCYEQIKSVLAKKEEK